MQFKNIWMTQSSVATVMTDVFQTNWYNVRNKIVKISKVFEKLEHLKNQGVTFWSENDGSFIVLIFNPVMSGYHKS
jgi:hypothetical protein